MPMPWELSKSCAQLLISGAISVEPAPVSEPLGVAAMAVDATLVEAIAATASVSPRNLRFTFVPFEESVVAGVGSLAPTGGGTCCEVVAAVYTSRERRVLERSRAHTLPPCPPASASGRRCADAPVPASG